MRHVNQLIDYMPKKKLHWIESIWRDPITKKVCLNLNPGFICDHSKGRTIIANDVNDMIEIFRRTVHVDMRVSSKIKLVQSIRLGKTPKQGKIHLDGVGGYTFCNTPMIPTETTRITRFEGERDQVTCELCKAKHFRETEKLVSP